MRLLFLYGLLGDLESVSPYVFFYVIILDRSLLGKINNMYLIFKFDFGCFPVRSPYEAPAVQELAL